MDRTFLALVLAAAAGLATPALAWTDYYADKHPPAADQKGDDKAPAPVAQKERVRADLDHVFGPGHWRETSGYRSRAREDELRREGAGTVRPGEVSHHSMGTPDAPGAYDVVVPGLPNAVAAAKLKSESSNFSRVYAEGAHGREGQHLHLEPNNGSDSVTAAGSALKPVADDNIYLRIVGGRRNPALGAVVIGRSGS
ncbi:MAG TPA: hypothetical protein VGF42_05305 [Caulobacteraceae bacterium]